MPNDSKPEQPDPMKNFTNAVKTITSVPKDAVTKPEPQKSQGEKKPDK